MQKIFVLSTILLAGTIGWSAKALAPITMQISGMHCGSCAKKISKLLESQCSAVTIDSATGIGNCQPKDKKVTAAGVKAAVEANPRYTVQITSQ